MSRVLTPTILRLGLTVTDPVPYTRIVSTNQFPEPAEQASLYPGPSVSITPPPQSPESEASPAFWQLFLAVCTWIASAGFLLVVPVIVALPYLILKATSQSGLQPETLIKDKTLILLSILGVIPAHALSILVAWVVITSWGKRPFWETLKWSWPEDFGIWKRVSLAALALALLWLGSIVAKALGGGETDIDQLINSSTAARITLAVVATATAPFVEEVIYRGVLYSAFERAFGAVLAVLIVSVMFGGVHVVQYRKSLGVIVVIMMLSVALTLVRAITGRLLPCFLMHLVFNGVQSIYIVMEPYIESMRHAGKAAGLTLQTIAPFFSQLG